jgi:Flp pilus assembly pilin Flp
MFISPATESGKNMLIDLLGKFLKDEEGQSVVEYALLLTLIAAATVLVLTAMGLSITKMFGSQEITVENYTTWAVENGRKKEE